MSEAMEVVVRAATEADTEALAQLITEFTGTAITPAQIGARLTLSAGVEYPVVAQMGEDIVGFASLRIVWHYLGEDAPYAELSELYVRSGYRRQGVGRALIEDLEAQARKAGASSWSVLTASDNTAALALYQASGFHPFSIALQKWFVDERPYREAKE